MPAQTSVLRRPTQRQRVRDALKRMILRGRFRPGQKLAQHILAARFGVSQGVVREALLELRELGLVQPVGKSGLSVSRLGFVTLMEAFDVREAMEGMIARLCSQRASRDEARELIAMAHDIHALAVAGRRKAKLELDKGLHTRLLQMCGNAMFQRLAEQYLVMNTLLRVRRDFEVVRDEHLASARAIVAGQADQAEAAVRLHVRNTKLAVQAAFHEGGSSPDSLKRIIPPALLA